VQALSRAEARFERHAPHGKPIPRPLLFAVTLALPMPGLSGLGHRLMAILFWVSSTARGADSDPRHRAARTRPLRPPGGRRTCRRLRPFANPIIFLFLGSFLLAEGMIAHRLNERFALTILSVRWLLARPWRLAIAVGLVPLSVSMWISDSATTAMIYPILLGILATLRSPENTARGARYETGLLLTISYAALIGGIGTPVGTPPNLIGIGMLEKLAGVRILFFQWMLLAVPILLVLAALMFLTMSRLFPAVQANAATVGAYVRERRLEMRAWTRGERNALAAFLVAVVLWVFPGSWPRPSDRNRAFTSSASGTSRRASPP